MEKVSKDQAILKMLEDGKSYTDIVAALNVSPTRIIVLKKKIALKEASEANIKVLKDKIKLKTEEIKNTDTEPEREYFESKFYLSKRLSEISGKTWSKMFNQISCKKGQKQQIRIKLDYYVVERISYREWTLIKTGEL